MPVSQAIEPSRQAIINASKNVIHSVSNCEQLATELATLTSTVAIAKHNSTSRPETDKKSRDAYVALTVPQT